MHTSTSEVYGTAASANDEGQPLRGQSPYSAPRSRRPVGLSSSPGLPPPGFLEKASPGPQPYVPASRPGGESDHHHQILAGARELKLAPAPHAGLQLRGRYGGGFSVRGRSPRTLGETVNIGSGFEFGIGATARLIAEVWAPRYNLQDDQRLRPERSEVERCSPPTPWPANRQADPDPRRAGRLPAQAGKTWPGPRTANSRPTNPLPTTSERGRGMSVASAGTRARCAGGRGGGEPQRRPGPGPGTVDAAARAGADAVKFQTFRPRPLATARRPSRLSAANDARAASSTSCAAS